MAFGLAPYQIANRGGIPRLEATSVSVGTANVTFNFRSHRTFGNPFIGLILMKLPELPTGTLATLPLVFSSDGNTQAVTLAGGDAMTVGNYAGAGLYLFAYESTTNTLQLIAPAA